MLKKLRQRQPTRTGDFAHMPRDGRHHALKRGWPPNAGLRHPHTAIFYEQPDSNVIDMATITISPAACNWTGWRRSPVRRRRLLPVRPCLSCASNGIVLLERGIDPQQIRYEVFGPELLGALN